MYRIFFEIQKKHWWFASKKIIILDAISRYANLTKDSYILDIGCGSGLMLNELEKLGNTTGMDMSNEAISFSKEIFKGTIKQGFLPHNVPFEANQFNLITALDVIEHIEEDIESLKSIRRILNEHKRRYTLPELKFKLQQSGLTIEKISYYNTFLFPIAYAVRKLNNLFGRNGSSDIDMPGNAVNFLLQKIFSFEKFFLRFLNFPFGVSILAVVKK